MMGVVTWYAVLVLVACFGLVLIVLPGMTARWNDSASPSWLRNFRYRSYPGRTSPLLIRLIGVMLVGIAAMLWWAGNS